MDITFLCNSAPSSLLTISLSAIYLAKASKYDVLNDHGIIFHSFWYGQGQEEYHGLLFTYYHEAELREMLEKSFVVLDIQRYTEIDENDSLYVIGKKS